MVGDYTTDPDGEDGGKTAHYMLRWVSAGADHQRAEPRAELERLPQPARVTPQSSMADA